MNQPKIVYTFREKKSNTNTKLIENKTNDKSAKLVISKGYIIPKKPRCYT